MSSAVPTLGYPTRTAAILALQQAGVKNQEIASRIGIPVKTVSALSARATGKPADRRLGAYNRETAPRGGIEINIEVRLQLRPHAAKRDLTVEALMALLIERIAEDKLVDAILDDKGVSYK